MKTRSNGSLAVNCSTSEKRRPLSSTRSTLFITRIGFFACPAKLFDQLIDILVDALGSVDEHHHLIGVRRARPGARDHRLIEAALRREDARRIDQHELALALHGDAANLNARRLHLARDDRDLGADERVDQRRLAGVGRADDGDHAAAAVFAFALLAFFASANLAFLPDTFALEQRHCGGLLCGSFRRAFAARRRRPLMWTSEVKRGA